jgi:hypothetical protein
MRLFIILFTCFFHFSALASDKVRIHDVSNLSVSGYTSASFTLNSTAPSGDATSDSAPAKVYIPISSAIGNSGAITSVDYSVLKSKYGVTSLYNIANSAHIVTFPLSISVGAATPKYIYMAVKAGSSTNYYVSARSSLTYSDLANEHIDFSFSPYDICKSVIYNSTSSVCTASSGALDSASLSAVLFKPLLYFFLTDEVIATDGSATIVPSNANYSGGIYLEAQMSNKIYTKDTFIVSLSDLRKGDARLVGDYSANATMDSTLFDKVIAYQYVDTTTTISTNVPVGAASAGAIVDQNLGTNQSGEFTLSGLTNSTLYKISIAFQDKFLFATALSTSKAETPTEIQELLKKQACYLLTAGFGEEHYVINYFRHFRDTVLVNSRAGKLFIHFYYITAPTFAPIIYKSPFLRAAFRGIGYTLYFLFNYPIVLILGLLLAVLGINLGKIKFALKTLRL